MRVDVIAVGSYQKRLEFAVPPDRVKDELDTAFRDVAKRARIPGFRQGKAPRQVLEMRFGPGIRADVAQSIIQKSYEQAIGEHKLEPVSRPQISDRGEVEGSEEFRFTITVDVKPSIELRAYTGLEVVYPQVTRGELQEGALYHLDVRYLAQLCCSGRIYFHSSEIGLREKVPERGKVLADIRPKFEDTGHPSRLL